MSQMPSKIWLHKDTKYSTGDIIFAQAIEDEGGIENFVKYVPADAFIEKAVGRLKHYLDNSVWVANDVGVREKQVIIEDFKKYMEQ